MSEQDPRGGWHVTPRRILAEAPVGQQPGQTPRRDLYEFGLRTWAETPERHEPPGRSLQTQCLQALLLGIAYNIYRLWFFALLAI